MVKYSVFNHPLKDTQCCLCHYHINSSQEAYSLTPFPWPTLSKAGSICIWGFITDSFLNKSLSIFLKKKPQKPGDRRRSPRVKEIRSSSTELLKKKKKKNEPKRLKPPEIDHHEKWKEKEIQTRKGTARPSSTSHRFTKDFPQCLVGAHRNAQGPGRKQIIPGCHGKITDPWGFCGAVIKAIIALITLGRNERNWRWKGPVKFLGLSPENATWRSLCEMHSHELSKLWDYPS